MTGSEITICISLHSLVALVNVTVFNRVIFNLYKELYVQCESLSCFAIMAFDYDCVRECVRACVCAWVCVHPCVCMCAFV